MTLRKFTITVDECTIEGLYDYFNEGIQDRLMEDDVDPEVLESAQATLAEIAAHMDTLYQTGEQE